VCRFRLLVPLRLPRPVHLIVSLAMPISRKQARVRERAVLRSERSGTHRPSIAAPLDAAGLPSVSAYYARIVCNPHDAMGVRCRGIAGGRRR
jgi:hypothetical protein